MPDCTNCGAFAGEEKWRKLCGRCFRLQKQKEYESLEEELAAARADYAELRQAVKKGIGLGPTIPPDRLKALIQLCHPDKHGGSKAASDMTQWLLSLRKVKS